MSALALLFSQPAFWVFFLAGAGLWFLLMFIIAWLVDRAAERRQLTRLKERVDGRF